MALVGRLMAEEAAYRIVDEDRGVLSRGSGAPTAEARTLRLVKVPGGEVKFQLHLLAPGAPAAAKAAPAEALLLDDDWDLFPESLEALAAGKQEFALRPAPPSGGATATGGAAVALWSFELRRKGHFLDRMLNPNTAIPAVEHPEEEPQRLRLGFAGEQSAAEWYALLALCTRDGGDGAEDGAAALGQARAVAAA